MNQVITEVGKRIIKEVTPTLKRELLSIVNNIGTWIIDIFKRTDWKEVLSKNPDFPNDINIIPIEKEFLTNESLLEIAKQYIVPNSNEVLAMLGKNSQKYYYVYLAYSKDKEMIPRNENNFVIIKTEGLSKEVLSLFNQHELIILK